MTTPQHFRFQGKTPPPDETDHGRLKSRVESAFRKSTFRLTGLKTASPSVASATAVTTQPNISALFLHLFAPDNNTSPPCYFPCPPEALRTSLTQPHRGSHGRARCHVLLAATRHQERLITGSAGVVNDPNEAVRSLLTVRVRHPISLIKEQGCGTLRNTVNSDIHCFANGSEKS